MRAGEEHSALRNPFPPKQRLQHAQGSQSVLLTGGGVFCRHSRRYTILASSFTYSTS